MTRVLPLALLLLSLAGPAFAADTIEPVSKRFAAADVQDVPDFRSHVAPLLGRLGCNGRACHGSFQGQGGFRLSLFGYDFKLDHESLVTGDDPRVDLKTPENSLMLQKPMSDEFGHGGGHRLDEGSWQYRLFLNWIKGGAQPVAADHADLSRLEVTPAEIVFNQQGQTQQLKVVAHWSDGRREDVTPLCRFQTNSEQVAEISDSGLITAAEPGDTHVVIFYDAAVVPVPVMRPVTDRVGPRYPDVPVPTEIDALVVQKLRKLGIVPSDVSDDAEFLRRVSLDLTGTLPTARDVEAFLADSSPDKRARKIDELLETPAYVAWWTTRLCDMTGNNDDSLNNVVPIRGRASQDWYDWIHRRVADNTPYDELVAGIVTAVSRNDGESYTEYCKTMSALYRNPDEADYGDRQYMPHYWARRTVRTRQDRAISFAYSFLGIRIQCAQCHKHPFDQWTQQDFEQFTGFFTRVNFNTNPAARDESEEIRKALGLEGQRGNQLRRALPQLLREGKTIPFNEVYTVSPRPDAANGNRNNRAVRRLREQAEKLTEKIKELRESGEAEKAEKLAEQLKATQQRIRRAARRGNRRRGGGPATAKLLGGEVVQLNDHADARTPLMEWLRDADNPYFARALVNRVWANYFNVGIVDPPDDLSLANPPSNKPLLDYLAQGFIDNNFDMKWLHREITNSRTYQLSWRPNETNRLDRTNFSHAVPRRLPAEIVYDALQFATASDARVAGMHRDMEDRAIAIPGAGRRRNRTSYALQIFGRSVRESNCDCDRSEDASLLQTVFLRNDGEVLEMIDDRRESWLSQVARELTGRPLAAAGGGDGESRGQDRFKLRTARLRRLIREAKKSGNEERAARLETRLKRQLARGRTTDRKAGKQESQTDSAGKTDSTEARQGAEPPDVESLVRQAYLRTLSRQPTAAELSRSLSYIESEKTTVDGLRGLLWALINTKEFIVNH